MIKFKSIKPKSTEPSFDRSLFVLSDASNKSGGGKKITYIKPKTIYQNRNSLETDLAKILLCQKDPSGNVHIIYQKIENNLENIGADKSYLSSNRTTMALQAFISNYR